MYKPKHFFASSAVVFWGGGALLSTSAWPMGVLLSICAVLFFVLGILESNKLADKALADRQKQVSEENRQSWATKTPTRFL